MNKLKNLIYYHLRDFIKPLLLAYGLLLGVWTSNTYRAYLEGKRMLNFPELDRTIRGVYLGSWSLLFVSIGVIFIVSIIFHKRTFLQMTQIGITRRRFLISRTIAIMFLSFLVLILLIITQNVNYLVVSKIYDFVEMAKPLEFAFYGVLLTYASVLSILAATVVSKIGLGKSILLYFIGRFVLLELLVLSPTFYSVLDILGITSVILWLNPVLDGVNILADLIPFLTISLLLFVVTYIICLRTEIRE